ncbi:hypothetical protein Dimus_017166 [Dionaea muscipula]
MEGPTPQMETSGESDSPVANNGQSSSRKRSRPHHRERSRLYLNPDLPISDTTGRIRGDFDRIVSRRTVDNGQASGSSIPVVQPAISHSQPNESSEGLHSMGQSTVTVGGTANASRGAFGVVAPLDRSLLSLLACHIEVFFSLSPLDQALVLLNPPPGRLLARFAHHLRALSTLSPLGQARVLVEINRTVAEIHAESMRNQMQRGVGIRIFENRQRWRAAVQREFELHLMGLDFEHMSYEELLALQEVMGNVSTGLSEQTILARINQQAYVVSNVDHGLGVATDPCTICLDDFEEGQNVGKLDCNHKFHFQCIKNWLLQKNSCPICKAPAAVQTP